MCLAELFVSTTCPLRHRWYHLLTPCAAGAHLSSCPSKKIALEGWEIKASFCPWCDSWDEIPPAEYLLLGSASNSNICSQLGGGGRLSRVPSEHQSVSEARRDSRRGSREVLSRTSSTTSVGTMGGGFAGGGPVAEASKRNVAINERFDDYLSGGGRRILERSKSSGSDENGAVANGSGRDGETGSVNGTERMWSKARKKSREISVFWK